MRSTLRHPFPHRLAPFGLVALVLGVSLGGCGDHQLETGYRYRPLNSSTLERRAFYADPYSIEAQKAATEREEDQFPVGGMDNQRRP